MSIFIRFFQIILLLVVIGCIMAFTLYNTHNVALNLPLLGFHSKLPLYFITGISLLSGIVLTGIYYAVSHVKKTYSSLRYIKRLERENDAMVKELEAYKTEERGRQNIKKLTSI